MTSQSSSTLTTGSAVDGSLLTTLIATNVAILVAIVVAASILQAGGRRGAEQPFNVRDAIAWVRSKKLMWVVFVDAYSSCSGALLGIIASVTGVEWMRFGTLGVSILSVVAFGVISIGTLTWMAKESEA